MGVKRIVSIIFIIAILSVVSAHVPKTADENHTLEDAKIVNDPTKSWVIYSELHESGGVDYYKMELGSGEKLKVSLLIPEDGGFVPSLVLIGPGIDSNDSLPDNVEKPTDVGCKVIEGELGEKEYEPFTPGSYYHPAEYEAEVNESGTYHVAVYDNQSGGKYGLAVGYEERYGPLEWIMVPIDVIAIHMWEGQPLWFIFAPMIAVIGIGLTAVGWKKSNEDEGPDDVRGWALLAASLLYLGSGAMLFMQMVLAAANSTPGAAIILTFLFGLMPVILGFLLWRIAMKFKDPEREIRIKVAIYGALGLFVWAGVIIGPIIAIVSSLVSNEVIEKISSLR